MNIYDLEKQATPGPLDILRCSVGDGVRLREGLLCFDRNSPDARILAHCRNHFIEALQGMTFIRNELLATRGDETAEQLMSFINDAKTELANLVSKLEEVE